MITRETIEEVKNRMDIVDVISDFVSLKKSGQNYKALSPFNNEKTPSFFVVPAKGIFKDFSSGKGGDAISKGYNKDLLEKTGLNVKKEDGPDSYREYDRFRGRVIFPVHNLAGKVIAFGARMLGKEKNQPKYINSPETDICHKSDVLYGLYEGKNSIRQPDVCYLIEA